MSHTTDSGAINSGAINHVSFPGSESGLSLVQLVGTVSVTGTVTGIYLRLTASATTKPRAATSKPTTKVKYSIGAASAAQATGIATVISKVRRAATVAPTAPGTATIYRRIRQTAPTVSRAVVTAKPTISMRVLRAGSTTGRALASLGTVKKIYTAASRIAQATTSAAALRKGFSGAQTTGRATTASGVGRNRRLSVAATVSAIMAPVNSLLKRLVGASTTATTSQSVLAYLALRRRAVGVALAAPKSLDSSALTFRSAAGLGRAVTRATTRLKITVSASTVASFSGFTVALDYSITPAPGDRQMVVPLEERRMEVAAP